MHVQFRSKIDTKKLSSPLIGNFLTELFLTNQMSIVSRNSNHGCNFREQKENFSDNLGHDIWELFNVLIHTQLTESKLKRDI